MSNNDDLVYINSINPAYNIYDPDEETEMGPFAGIGLQYNFDGLLDDTVTVSLGLSGYYLNYGYVEGIEYPTVNLGAYETLDYHFKTKSYALMLEPRVIYSKHNWQPYLFGGLGSSWNRSYHYNEKPSNPAGYAVAAAPFESKTVTDFAYEVGVGFQYIFDQNPKHLFKYLVSVDYRYMNMGHAELDPRENQTTSGHLDIDDLTTQALVFSLITVF